MIPAKTRVKIAMSVFINVILLTLEIITKRNNWLCRKGLQIAGTGGRKVALKSPGNSGAARSGRGLARARKFEVEVEK